MSQPVGGAVVVVLAATLWFAWLGWDRQYQTDPETGISSGPYAAWQVIGCAVCLLVVLVGAVVTGIRPLLAGAALTAGFTAVWTVDAASQDETGLFMVGALLLFVGLASASAAVAFTTLVLSRRWQRR